MSWFVLFLAGLLEVVWAIGLKYTHGFTRLTPSIITVSAMIISIVMLSWGDENAAGRHRVRGLDGYWGRWRVGDRHVIAG